MIFRKDYSLEKSRITTTALILYAAVILLLSPVTCSAQDSGAQSPLKPRIVILTDPRESHEADDGQSLVRLMCFADMVEIEALIASTGWNWWKSSHIDAGFPELQRKVAAYGQCVDNLMKRSGQAGFKSDESRQEIGYWPSPGYLEAITVRGTARDYMTNVGDGKDNDGSNLIIQVVDEEDERPVWILVWGGPNCLAQAIWDVAENPLTKRTQPEIERFLSKLRVIAITDQDTNWSYYTGRSAGDYVSKNSGYWLRKRFPELFYVKMDLAMELFAGPDDAFKAKWQAFYSQQIQGKGPLGSEYPTHNRGIEGDTPSLLYMLPVGINSPEHPILGGLGGVFRFGQSPWEQDDSWHWTDKLDAEAFPGLEEMSAANSSLWLDDVWTDFAARIQWSATGEGNRNPEAAIWQDTGHEIIFLSPAPGETITLDASRSRDPDGDNLSFTWIPYPYAEGTVKADDYSLGDMGSSQLELTAPAQADGAIDLILEARDDGEPYSLVDYRRVRIQVDPDRKTGFPWTLASLPFGEESGWMISWMGDLYFDATLYPWFYHNELGWLYADAEATGQGGWFFHPEQGWLFTSGNDYPQSYSARTATWINTHI